MAEVKAKAQEKDFITPAAMVLGVGALGLGVYFLFKKPAGVSPGDVAVARVGFKYLGAGGDYHLQIRLGDVKTQSWFVEQAGFVWGEGITLDGPNDYKAEISCEIPSGARKASYGAEFAIQTIGMQPWEHIVRVLVDNALEVR
jgi:hypothetical protein